LSPLVLAFLILLALAIVALMAAFNLMMRGVSLILRIIINLIAVVAVVLIILYCLRII
jgi:hypothetical protein